jgi:hypothetical protein
VGGGDVREGGGREVTGPSGESLFVQDVTPDLTAGWFDWLLTRFIHDMQPRCPIELPGGWRLTAEQRVPSGHVDFVLFGFDGAYVRLEPPEGWRESMAAERAKAGEGQTS